MSCKLMSGYHHMSLNSRSKTFVGFQCVKSAWRVDEDFVRAGLRIDVPKFYSIPSQHRRQLAFAVDFAAPIGKLSLWQELLLWESATWWMLLVPDTIHFTEGVVDGVWLPMMEPSLFVLGFGNGGRDIAPPD